jgi:hypothetical protein
MHRGFQVGLSSALLLVCASGAALAQSHPICGSPPEIKGIPKEEEDRFKGQLDGRAKILSKLIGDASLAGQVETTKKTITQDFPDLDQAIKFRYFQYVVCVTIMNDTTLSTPQKIEALEKIRPSLGSERYRQKYAYIDQLDIEDRILAASIILIGEMRKQKNYSNSINTSNIINEFGFSKPIFDRALRALEKKGMVKITSSSYWIYQHEPDEDMEIDSLYTVMDRAKDYVLKRKLVKY